MSLPAIEALNGTELSRKPPRERLWALVIAGGDAGRLPPLTRKIAGAPIRSGTVEFVRPTVWPSSRLPWFIALSWPQRGGERSAKGERNPSCRLQEACLSLQGQASDRCDKASRSRRHTHGTRAAVAGVGVFIWILLALAYAWNVRKLARMGRAPDPWSSAQSPSSDALHIELVHAEEKHRNRRPTTGPQQRWPAVALPRR